MKFKTTVLELDTDAVHYLSTYITLQSNKTITANSFPPEEVGHNVMIIASCMDTVHFATGFSSTSSAFPHVLLHF